MEATGKHQPVTDATLYHQEMSVESKSQSETSILQGVSDSTKEHFPSLTQSIEKRQTFLDSMIDDYAPSRSSSTSSGTRTSSLTDSMDISTSSRSFRSSTEGSVSSLSDSMIIDSSPERVATIVEALKVDSVVQPQFEKFREGKVKEVHREVGVDSKYVYYTAKEETETVSNIKKIPIIGDIAKAAVQSPLEELMEEAQFGNRVEEARTQKNLGESVNLATKMEVSDVQIGGKPTFKVLNAESGDLEGVISNKEKQIPFHDRMQIGAGIINGMAELHEADHVHGDTKPENVLVYAKKSAEDEPIQHIKAEEVKIADFGKARPIKEGERLPYRGNPRNAPPEQLLSKKGEVYSTSLMLIRNFEEEFLDKKGTPLLTGYTLDSRGTANEKRRGLEIFLVENKECTQSEIESVSGKVSFGMRGIMKSGKDWMGIPQTTKYVNAERELHNYIDALTTKMEDAHPDHKEAIQDLNKLLKSMTRTNPDEIPKRLGQPMIPGRPMMDEVRAEYTRIMSMMAS